jgi:1-acyl-sn-glycerol-3-phosphate acyltransferase
MISVHLDALTMSDHLPATTSTNRPFRAAKPSPTLIGLARSAIAFDLAFTNKLHIDDADIQRLRRLPDGMGALLTPNHADEADPMVCLEISHRASRRFVSMCNRDAFDEYMGIAGWALERLGNFSVERGAHDGKAKTFAIDVVAEGKNTLVIFPEGEIFYLNEMVRPFHDGAIEIGMQAVTSRRQRDAHWTAFVVPMAIKYTYPESIAKILEERVQRMERDLDLAAPTGATIQKRMKLILGNALDREAEKNKVPRTADGAKLTEHIRQVSHEILEQLEEKYDDPLAAQRATIDASWELSAKLREMIAQGAAHPEEIRHDLSVLHKVANMVSWQPRYVSGNPSQDRLAELLMKLEREIYSVRRPRQLARREVHVKIGEPISLADHYAEYHSDQHVTRHKITNLLHDRIQEMVDELAARRP